VKEAFYIVDFNSNSEPVTKVRVKRSLKKAFSALSLRFAPFKAHQRFGMRSDGTENNFL
jgi:hypothetical protein